MTDGELENFGPIDVVGDWVVDKHSTLCKYIEICQYVRRKFTRAGATYIDLYSGAGKARIQGSKLIIDGSPLAAAKQARDTNSGFRKIYIADSEWIKVDACRSRLSDEDFDVEAVHGPSEQTVLEIVSRLHPDAFHFAFLDPFSIELPFSVIEALAQLRSVDMLVHISDMDLKRNVENEHIDAKRQRLDRFCPGWRDALDLKQPKRDLANAVLNLWKSKVDGLGLKRPAEIRSISAGRQSRIYHLVLLSQNDSLSKKFWNAVIKSENQNLLLF